MCEPMKTYPDTGGGKTLSLDDPATRDVIARYLAHASASATEILDYLQVEKSRASLARLRRVLKTLDAQHRGSTRARVYWLGLRSEACEGRR